MKYRNKKNGAIIDVKAELGGDWMPVEAPKKAETKKAEKPAPKKGTSKK